MSLNICVFCGSSPGSDSTYIKQATRLGKQIAYRQYKLIYGGGGLGLMGAVARAAHENGAGVLGIIPNFLSEAEKTFTQVKHIFVPDMHSRKLKMFDEADGFIVLPGGIGTLEEVIEILSWARLNLHHKPVVFLSDNGFWDSLITVFEHMINTDFIEQSFSQEILTASTPQQALDLVEDRIANPIIKQPLSLTFADKV